MKHKKILTLLAAALMLTACGTDNDVDSTSIFDTSSPERNEFDMWLKTNFTDKYNIDVIYRYNDKETDNYYNVVPAELDKAKALAILVKHMWLEAYEEVAGADFIKKYAPRIYQFIGSAEFNPNSGSIVLGTAEGGLKITLFRVNAIDPDSTYINYDNPFRPTYEEPLDLNYWFFHTMHHEFCHILTQTKNYTTDFQTISAGDYSSSDWVNFVDENGDGPAAGFVSGYASSEYNEDFAEIYSTYVSLSEEGWQKLLERGKKPLTDENGELVYKKDSDGKFVQQFDTEAYDKMVAKFNIVKEYFQNSWGISLDELRDVVLRRSAESVTLDLRTLK